MFWIISETETIDLLYKTVKNRFVLFLTKVFMKDLSYCNNFPLIHLTSSLLVIYLVVLQQYYPRRTSFLNTNPNLCPIRCSNMVLPLRFRLFFAFLIFSSNSYGAVYYHNSALFRPVNINSFIACNSYSTCISVIKCCIRSSGPVLNRFYSLLARYAT